MIAGSTTRLGMTRQPARLAFAIIVILLITIAGPRSALTQPGLVSRESQLKAAYIYKFIGYVGFPQNAFDSPQAPLVFGVIGDDPVNRYLKVIAKKKRAGSRPIKYVEIEDADSLPTCHIIFVGDQADPQLTAKVIDSVQKNWDPVLIVGETEGFVGEAGGTLEFFIANNRVRIKLSRRIAEASNLKVSSQLAKLSKVVD